MVLAGGQEDVLSATLVLSFTPFEKWRYDARPVLQQSESQAASPSSMTPNTTNKLIKLNGKPPAKHNGQGASKRVLSDHVQDSIDEYFQALNGHQPTDLYRMVMEQVEAPLLRSVLDYCDMNQSRASEVLGINRGTLRKKLKQYDIQA